METTWVTGAKRKPPAFIRVLAHSRSISSISDNLIFPGLVGSPGVQNQFNYLDAGKTGVGKPGDPCLHPPHREMESTHRLAIGR